MRDDVDRLVDRLRESELPSPAERRAIRERAGATLADIGRAVGVTGQAVYYWERGHSPQRHHAIVYARVLSELARLAKST